MVSPKRTKAIYTNWILRSSLIFFLIFCLVYHRSLQLYGVWSAGIDSLLTVLAVHWKLNIHVAIAAVLVLVMVMQFTCTKIYQCLCSTIKTWIESWHGTNILWQDINLHSLLSTQVLNGYPVGCDHNWWSNSFWASSNAWLECSPGSGDCAHSVHGKVLNTMTWVIVYV